MSPTPGVPDAESEEPTARAELLPAEAVGPEDIGVTETDKSLTEIISAPETGEEVIAVARPAGKRGRPARQTLAPITWSIRGVTRDTRTLLEQAAGRVGKTLGQYLNEDVRVCVEQQLQLTAPPATLAALQKQIYYLRQLVENLTTMVRAPDAKAAPGEGSPD